ncbi:MAG: TetR/AcrR family transcriptional regulator, tetracycline repressor protein [Actinomycetota bacterium]|nr:TetR/AcrR family transcriptional regulator, tetracycline repressor protein [Actinomycetota bacterium]
MTPERIFDAGLTIVDEAGVEGLSMRRLGAALGVDPMAIYHHVPNKEALFHGIVRRVLAEMPMPGESGSWPTRVRQWARAYRAVVVAHPHLVLRIVTSPDAVAVAAGETNGALYRSLQLSGLGPADIERGAGVIVDYVNGAVLAKATPPSAGEPADREPAGREPAERETADRELDEVLDDVFEFGLDVVIAGLLHYVP